MSFWRTFGFHTVSAVETILDRESFTLEELLDEEEILQEVKSQNKKLLDLYPLSFITWQDRQPFIVWWWSGEGGLSWFFCWCLRWVVAFVRVFINVGKYPFAFYLFILCCDLSLSLIILFDDHKPHTTTHLTQVVWIHHHRFKWGCWP